MKIRRREYSLDNGGKQKIDYIRLIRAIWGHWKLVFQDKQFRKAMLKCIVGTITFTAFWIFLFSLDPTGKELLRHMEEIEPPQNAILVKSPGTRNGLIYYYKFPGMSGEEVRMYYKTELKKKKWKYKGKDQAGNDIYEKYSDSTPHLYSFVLQDCRPSSKEYDYDWRLSIYQHKGKYDKSLNIATPPEKEDEDEEEEQEGLFFGGGQR